METKLIPGQAARANDATILSALEDEAQDGGGNTMVVGIRNEVGAIYRIITTDGLGEFMGVVGALANGLGMTDELEKATSMKEGCDAIFS